MIFGIGTDIARCTRMARIYERHGERLLKNILTPAEQALMKTRKKPVEFITRCWSAKEAISKALGTGMGEFCFFSEIEILSNPAGKPFAVLAGRTLESARQFGITKIHLSISHERDYIVAMALLECADTPDAPLLQAQRASGKKS